MVYFINAPSLISCLDFLEISREEVKAPGVVFKMGRRGNDTRQVRKDLYPNSPNNTVYNSLQVNPFCRC